MENRSRRRREARQREQWENLADRLLRVVDTSAPEDEIRDAASMAMARINPARAELWKLQRACRRRIARYRELSNRRAPEQVLERYDREIYALNYAMAEGIEMRRGEP